MKHLKRLCVLMLIGLSAGCATRHSGPTSPPPPDDKIPPLRVGVVPNDPPLIFNQQGKLSGAEVDWMRRVMTELGRPVKAVPLPQDEVMEALLGGKVDVIMSGLTVTPSRKVRMQFTEPWMTSGLMAMMRIRDAGQFASARDIGRFSGRIGVVSGTTGHEYVQKNCPHARVVRIASAGDAAIELQQNTIDLFIDDIPSVLWQSSVHAAELTCLLERLTTDQIAWAVRRGDDPLLAQLNGLLQKWKSDGSLHAGILKWIPYYDSIK